MAENTTGYHFKMGVMDKRLNSTKKEFTVQNTFVCQFKQPCSMESPSIMVVYNSLNVAPPWNYCHCDEINKDYWVTDIISIRANHWEIHLAVDALATYRDEIKKTQAFILYGFNTDASGALYRLKDTRIAVSMVPISYVTDFQPCPDTVNASGCFVLSAVGKGGVQSYCLTKSKMASLLTAIDIEWTALTAAMVRWELALPQFMNKLLYGGNAVDCIRSCIWVPFDPSVYGGGSDLITLGNFDTGVSAPVVSTNANVLHSVTAAIPWPVTDWKRLNCLVQLYLPFFGTIDIPADKCNNYAELTVNTGFSLIDGGVSCEVRAGDLVLYTGSTNISAPYAIGSSNENMKAALGTGMATIGGGLTFIVGAMSTVFSGGVVSAAATAAAATGLIGGGAKTIEQSVTPINNAVGTLGGASSVLMPLDGRITVLYYRPIGEGAYNKVYGNPVFQMGTPAAGYCQTAGFSLAAAGANADEISTVNTAMDSGVFIE